jgi:hypothetical protein
MSVCRFLGDWLRVHTAKPGVALLAQGVYLQPQSGQHRFQVARSGAVHGVRHHAIARFVQLIQPNELVQTLQIVGYGVQRADGVMSFHRLRVSLIVGQQRLQLLFDAVGNFGKGGAAVVGLEFDAVKDGRVVAGGEDDSTLQLTRDDGMRGSRG